MNTFSSKKAFSLIELLIVTAIITILAAIALPNFLEAQTRARVARVKSDMRAIGTAVESYAVDNSGYPPSPIGLGARFRGFKPLTTPVSYLSDIPEDPFLSTDSHGEGRFSQGMYQYGAMPLDVASRWAIASDGPDRADDVTPIQFYPGYSEDLFEGKVDGFSYTLYDPTNGTLSRGDLFRANDFTPAI